jgi:hypothetical protein
MKKILDGGVVGLASYRGTQLKAHLAWLRVCVGQKPSLTIGSPQVSIQNLKVDVSATGELWWYYPIPHCSSWCLDWSITWAWTRIASITIRDIRIAADAHADTSVDGTKVKVTGVFDRLRLDYDILRDIQLEGIANSVLGSKPVFVYDASQLVATVPVLGSHFGISAIDLPSSIGSIEVDVSVKQV